ncbi:MAG: sulfur oxidation c-type cytochrome SoxA [Acidiphilium sp. 34-60-192]|nr:MAG: sulfur oxidation c-type cytochrome SoxA [Acidiphilium sp. 34-60-192]
MRLIIMALMGASFALFGSLASARAATPINPQADMKAFQGYFLKRFPKVPLAAYVNGPYNFSKSEADQWKQIMEFPPYQFALDTGKSVFNTKFPNGKDSQNYPMFDPKTGRVVTLGIAINRCRVANGLKKLKLTTGPMADILAYMTSTSDGKPINVVVPNNPKALAAYRAGKEYFYSRRGQLNFSCASCHVQEAGMHLRGNVLAPALGMTAAFPLYRSKWGNMGTLVRRFIGCNKKVHSVPAKPDSAAYRDLAYFLTYMNNGLPVSGPGARP